MKSKAERLADEAAARDAALSKSILDNPENAKSKVENSKLRQKNEARLAKLEPSDTKFIVELNCDVGKINGFLVTVSKKEISDRLLKVLYTFPWTLDNRWSMIDEKQPLDRKDAIKSFLPLVFKKKENLVKAWRLS